MNQPPIRVNVERGGIIECQHMIKAAIVSSSGEVLHTWGDVESPVFPRSSIKAMQVLAFIEANGAEQFGFSNEEIAICCASHNGEPEHVATVEAMLNKIGFSEADFECGCHWPLRVKTGYELAGSGKEPSQLHNNCSGKHAGMLAFAKILNVPVKGYIGIDHEVQKQISNTMADMCEYDYINAAWSPDGCSAPTWAIPLTNLALAFAKFANPEKLSPARQSACKKIYQSVVEHPFMVAGTERYCTDMMNVLGNKVFLKTGAEGVYVAAIPELKLAISIKCEDGATRAAESVMTALLDFVGITKTIADEKMVPYRSVDISNWNKIKTGDITCTLP